MRRMPFLVMLWAAASLGNVTLVQEGVPRADVVLPDDASETLQLAAKELQTHVALVSGARLRITTEGAATHPLRIHVGLTGAAAGMDLPLTEADVGFDGYVVRTTADAIAIAGPRDKGTLNGVYGFLEGHLGVRWYYPGPLGTHVPTTPTITVGAINEVSRPRFATRKPWYNSNATSGYSDQEKQEYGIWVRRNRAGGMSGYVGHHWVYSIPFDRYFAEHPEYFAEIQGQRRRSQLCTTNADVVDLYTADILGRFAADPDFRYASMSPNDGAGWCECKQCLAISDDLTGRIVDFINRVAANVQPKYPDRYVAFYAYAGIVSPPAGAAKLEPGAMPWIAHYSVCQMHPLSDPTCPYQAGFRRKVEGWREISEQIGVREYASWWPVPCCESRRLANDTRYYASVGGIGMSREYLEVQYGTPLLMWLEHKLLWNPDRELSELLDDFFGRFYGSAGPAMQSVYRKLAARQEVAAPPSANWTGNNFEAPRIYPRDMLAQAVERVRGIEANVAESTAAERVRRERLALEHAVLWLDAWAADRQYANSGNNKEGTIGTLTALTEFRDTLPDNHVVSRVARNWATRQIELYGTDRTTVAKPGDWGFTDSYNAGGMARIDAEELVGLRASTWGLRLPRGREGHIQYRFVAKGDLRFTEAELHSLLLAGADGLRNRIEVRKDGGDWQVFAQGQAYSQRDHTYSLTTHIAGAREFRLRIWGRNESGRDRLMLDNFGIRGKAEQAGRR